MRGRLLVVQPLDAGARVVGLVADAVVVEPRLRKRATRVVHCLRGLGLLVLREASPLRAVVLLLLQSPLLLTRLHHARLATSLDGIGHHVQVLKAGTGRARDGHHLLPHHDAVLRSRLRRLLVACVARPAKQRATMVGRWMKPIPPSRVGLNLLWMHEGTSRRPLNGPKIILTSQYKSKTMKRNLQESEHYGT